MGLLRVAAHAAKGTMADQWKEYFYCDALPADVLAVKGQKRQSKWGLNKKGSENVISNGSVIAVADGQCMFIVEQGKIIDLCAEPGEYTYDTSTEPSIFTGSLNEDSIMGVLKTMGKRFTFGGEPAVDQRIYYVNTKEMIGNKYGTPQPVPFRVVDANVGLDVDISIRCFGEYSYRITNPLLFYKNVCGNVEDAYQRSTLDSQLKSELLTALQPAFARISEMGIRYSALPGHASDMADALNSVLSAKWKELRGIEIVSCGVSSVSADKEDEDMIKELQRNAAFRNPGMAAAHLVGAQASAMQAAANNTNGSAMAFMGMNMANNAGGINAQDLFRMDQEQQAATQNAQAAGAQQQAQKPATTSAAASKAWFCPECGAPNKGKFCTECGQKKPASALLYRCDKCGWEPEDPTKPPKFCPECGDPFGDEDIVR